MSRMVCGIQPVREAIRAHGSNIVRVCIETGDSTELGRLEKFARDNSISVERVERRDLDRLTKAARHQGVLAFAPELKFEPLTVLLESKPTFVILLDELEDPQNFGAVIRSAVALGADAIVFPEHHSAPLSMATFRASAGAVEHARICRVSSLTSAMTAMLQSGIELFGLDAQAQSELHAVDLRGPVGLVVGAEGKGLRKTVKQLCTDVVRLPMRGPIASLNASVAIAIAQYEVLRQRALNG
jgi:23S rRNA (guanosine2251-2'-O)-methyltransferase